jgi:L-arabinonolactonase
VRYLIHQASREERVARAQAELVLDCRNWLGESVIWDDRNSVLYWVDIHGKELWRWRPFEGGEPSIFSLPERPGAVGLRETAGLVLGMEKGFAFFDEGTGRLETVASVEKNLPTTRLNDGRVDPVGRFVCGGMDEAADQQPISAVYSLEPDRSVRRLIDGVCCSNSTCWGANGKTLYFTDMPTRRIDKFDYDVERGTISNRQPFALFETGRGLPDGSTVDSEGCLWNAVWGGGKIVRFTPDGRLDREIRLPVTNPTCLAFGAKDLDVLFVTSAWFGLTEEQHDQEPLAGSLFAVEPGVRGLPESRYAG